MSAANAATQAEAAGVSPAACPTEGTLISPGERPDQGGRGWTGALERRPGSADDLPGGMTATLRRCDDLEAELRRQASESEGIGLELIRAYEHLGIVFQLTRELSSVKSEHQVLELLVNSLRSSYPRDQISVQYDGEHGEFGGGAGEALSERSERRDQDAIARGGEAPARSPWPTPVGDDGGQARGTGVRARELAARSRKEHRTIVDGGESAAGVEGTGSQVISVPVFCGKEFVCAVQIERGGQGSAGAGAARGAEGRAAEAEEEAASPLNSGDMLLMDSLATFCGDLLRNFRLLGALRQASIDTVRALVSAVDQKDPYTCGHSTRVGYYATVLGKELGLADEELQMLHWSALLHDVGKIGIRDDVLNKVGKLTAEEMEHMKEHPRRGFEVVRQIPHFRLALDGILHHHERMDGTGYPDGLKGGAISLQARVIQIADIFDALTSTRSYRSAYDWRKALEIIRSDAQRGVSDPDLVETWARILWRVHSQDPKALEAIGQRLAPPDLSPDSLEGLDQLGQPRSEDLATFAPFSHS